MVGGLGVAQDQHDVNVELCQGKVHHVLKALLSHELARRSQARLRLLDVLAPQALQVRGSEGAASHVRKHCVRRLALLMRFGSYHMYMCGITH